MVVTKRDRFPDWNLIDEISLKLLEDGIGIYEILQKALPSVVLCKAENTDEYHIARMQKLFRLAQLQIEYILKTQAELLVQIEQMTGQIKSLRGDKAKLRKELLKGAELINILFKCEMCDKLFLRSNFLYDHIRRKHK